MFGGYGIFQNGVMFGMVTSGGDVYFKCTESNRRRFEEAGSVSFGRMPYYSIPKDALDDVRVLRDWAASSIAAAHESRVKHK